MLTEIKDIEKKISTETVFFFDLDGTLVDTNFANFLAYQKAIKMVLPLKQDVVYSKEIRFNRALLKDLNPNLNENEYNNIIKEKEFCFYEFIEETKLIKSTYNLLMKYHKKHRCILVTNSRKGRALFILDYYKLTNMFSEIICEELMYQFKEFNKFKIAVLELEISPTAVLAFENEDVEINKAISVGIKNIFKIL